MCGIAGIAGEKNPELIQQMTACLRHRGPDDEGHYFDEQVSLGHRRLAILDPLHGKQPMSSSDGVVHAVFNGQIYNYRKLREELAPEHAFATNCDTEILPILYQREGPGMLRHLRGMFAMAIWDAARQELFLARDRIGVKPLYYAIVGGRLLFASEIKALLCCPEVSRELDLVALDSYFSLLYIPADLSIYKGIQQLPPGHCMIWKAGRCEIQPYWKPEAKPQHSLSLDEQAEEIAPVLQDAIRARLISDVPLGAFLSGGIDSTTIVSVMASESRHAVETFCIGFGPEGAAYEERHMARRAARHFGTNHHEFTFSPDIEAGLEEMLDAFDEPFGNPTALLVSQLSKQTRQHVTVALSGDGGDEVFGGYPRYQGMLWARHLSHLPKKALSGLAQACRMKEGSTARNYRRWLRELLEGAQLPPAERFTAWSQHIAAGDKLRLYSPAFLEALQKEGDACFAVTMLRGHFNQAADISDVGKFMAADRMSYLPDHLLRYADRMSMRHSLEIRVPFTDHILIEAMQNIPASSHVGCFASKRLLRKIMKGRLPDFILKRRKLGLNPPMGIWLREGKQRLFDEYLSPERFSGDSLIQAGEVQRLLAEHRNGTRDHGLRLWSLIVYEAWRGRFLKG